MTSPVAPKKPMTVVSPIMQVTLDEMAGRVQKSRDKHGDLLQEYHKVWYESDHTWCYTFFLGIGLMKSPNDLWVYQQLITEFMPRTIIETGTYQGGSALWYAMIMQALGIDGHVWTIDIEDHRKSERSRHLTTHPMVTCLTGDSTDPLLVEALVPEIRYPLLISLDADHSAEHVRKELDLYAPLCRVGDWLVVEDTNISWGEPGEPHSDRGARGGLEDYLRAHEGEFRQDILCERYLLTMHPGGWLQRVAECTHD